MNITRTTVALSEFTWVNKNHPRGPECRFTITWKGTTEEDLVPAWSVPGFKLVKSLQTGEVVLRVPSARKSGNVWCHTCQISSDLATWIMETLKTTKMWGRVGQNYRPEKILDLPDDLLPDLPENVELY